MKMNTGTFDLKSVIHLGAARYSVLGNKSLLALFPS